MIWSNKTIVATTEHWEPRPMEYEEVGNWFWPQLTVISPTVERPFRTCSDFLEIYPWNT
jgi:hypothetical protein